MRKEVFFAIVLGLAVGALLVGGLWTANQALQSKSNPLISAESTPSASTSDNSRLVGDIALNVISPKDLTLIRDGKATIEGKTLPNTQIIIQSENDTLYLQSDENGTFSQNVDLVSGSNDLTVTAVTNTGDSSTRTVTVVYSTATI